MPPGKHLDREKMNIRDEVATASSQWRLLTAYEKFEQAVVIVLTILIALVVAVAVWNLALNTLGELIVAGHFDPTEQPVFQTLFGMMFTVIIALEFKRSLLVIAERQESIVQVRTVVLLAMLAALRKLIIVDLDTTSAGKLFGLSAAILALGIVYWLVRDQDRQLRT
jgi:uncharacterized membrane protein (DUF373 family)